LAIGEYIDGPNYLTFEFDTGSKLGLVSFSTYTGNGFNESTDPDFNSSSMKL